MVYDKLLDAWLPEICPGCRGSTAAGFCATCASAFAPLAQPCARCGLPLPVVSCPRLANTWSVDAIVAPLRYGTPLDRYVQALKYAGARKLGRAFGLLLAEHVHARAVDALVPVPLHPRRLRERGYNQAIEIAAALGRRLRIPLVIGGVHRRAGAPQTGLDAAARFANAARAFTVTRDLSRLRVAIVDDVITTGATVNAIARALDAAGARGVEAWAIARTLPQADRG